MEHHPISQPVVQRGFTLLEVLIGLSIFSVVIGSVYSGYTSVIDIVTKTQYSSAAVSIIESRVEMVRNMRYQDVGVVGGIPSGILAQSEEVALGNQSFTLTTTVRNIDNPFDGTIDGNPQDLNPADYKLVQFDMSCPACGQYGTLSMVTYIAPKTLEDESRNGSLEISVIDASGQPVPQASLRIVNAAASVDLTTTTDNQGKLLLLSVATGSAAYEITATKTGYSTDRTYPPDNPANALKPHVTVATQQLTLQTMTIDRVSTLTIQAQDRYCAPAGPVPLQLSGNKLIGILPNVPKYSSAHTVSANGSLSLNQLEWDQYGIIPSSSSSLVIAGTSEELDFTLDPNTTQTFTWVTASRSQESLLVTVTDLSGTALDGATVTVTGTSYNRTEKSGDWRLSDSDWSAGQYTDVSAQLDVSSPGQVTLLLQGGVYASGSAETLTSQTFDLGTSDASLRSVDFNPTSQPDGATIRFHVAANNDGTTWDFVGPDGTASTYFETSGQTTPSALNGKRYIRYRAYLQTTEELNTPVVEDVAIPFTSECLLDGHALIDGLTGGASYTVTVTAPGYTESTQSVTAPAFWQHLVVPLTPQ